MGKPGLFDLENHFAFYGAYHRNPINIFIHMLFVWPILFTALILFYFTPSVFSFTLIGSNQVFFLNLGFLFTLIYGVFYICLDKKSGSLAALLCFLCWVGSSFLASRLGFSLAWKECEKLHCKFVPAIGLTEITCGAAYTLFSSFGIDGSCCFRPGCFAIVTVVLASQLTCWTGQFIGHGVFEKRAPALFDNLSQAFIMAPFFVLFEALQIGVGYEPYPGFRASVAKKIEEEVKVAGSQTQEKFLVEPLY